MTESHRITTADNKNYISIGSDNTRVSYTSQFKYQAIRSRPSVSKFGGLSDSDIGPAESAGPKEGNQQHNELNCNTAQQTSTSVNRRTSRSGHSLFTVASKKRARRVRFYRNGDRFFKGLIFAVSNEQYRTFESLLSALTSSAVCDSKAMPTGVRYIFTLDGSRRLGSTDELLEGESYVCASSEPFRPLDYRKNEDPAWNTHMLHHEPNLGLLKKKERPREEHSSQNSETHSNSSSQSQSRPGSARDDKQSGCRSKSYKSDTSDSKRKTYDEYQRSFVAPRLITLIRNGRRPRKSARLLLNKRTAQSFDQVMSDITDIIKFDCGKVKKVYTMTGQQVMCLADFFQSEMVFLVCGHDKPGEEDFTLDALETCQMKAYRPFASKTRERMTIKRSANSSKASRFSQMASKDCRKDAQKPEEDETVPQEVGVSSKRQISAVNKDNVDAFIAHLPMPAALTHKYEVGTLIGTGNFAVVMECKDKRINKKYALKIINKDCCKGKEEMIDNEVRILRCVKHPNIIRLVEDYTSQHHIFCIMELVQGGDLFDAIATSTTKYTEQDASCMLYNLASALKYLHALYIVHRDVKPENILIRQHEDGTKSLKLGDFGLATEVKGPLYTVCGTPTYVAPEVISETGYGLKIDVWSAGVITYILLCGFPPFASPNDDQDDLFDMIMSGSYDYPSPYWDDVSREAKDVITGMLEINPDVRMSAAQVLDHKWVSRDNQYEADLRKNISHGLGTYFRRGPKSSQDHAGIKIIATTALDKASKFFRGRGLTTSTVTGKEVQ